MNTIERKLYIASMKLTAKDYDNKNNCTMRNQTAYQIMQVAKKYDSVPKYIEIWAHQH